MCPDEDHSIVVEAPKMKIFFWSELNNLGVISTASFPDHSHHQLLIIVVTLMRVQMNFLWGGGHARGP